MKLETIYCTIKKIEIFKRKITILVRKMIFNSWGETRQLTIDDTHSVRMA
jgi:hypothetical protein